jgi:hypothetical protein
MTCTPTRKRGSSTGRILALAVTAAIAWPAVASAAPQYPDLRVPSPSELRLSKVRIGGVDNYWLRFTTNFVNAGQGALELQQIPTPSGIADLNQRIYESPVGFTDHRLGSVVYSPEFFEVPDLARYEVWTERGFERAQRSGFTRGQPVRQVSNLKYCLDDSRRVDENAPPAPVYTCTGLVMGVSVGWAMTQPWFVMKQTIDFGPAPPPDGDYVLRAVADPDNLLIESEGKADAARESEVANSGTSFFRIVNGQLAGVE